MKHIVFVIGNYKNGGVPMRTTNLANEFAKMGYPSTILVTKEIGEDIFFELHDGVNIVSLNDYISLHGTDKAVKKNLIKRNLYLKLLKKLRYISKFFPNWDKKLGTEIRRRKRSDNIATFITLNPDCLYIPFGISYYEDVFYGSKGIGCKIIYAERNAPEAEISKEPIEKKRLFKILSKADGAVLQTRVEKDFYGNTLKNAVVINNPVKSGLSEPFEGERRKVVVNFCRISVQKNIPLVIKAFIEFRKTHPDYTLEIYGNTVEENEENLKKSYFEMISSLNAEDYIKILPPRADIHSVILDCAMFVSSSNYEGLSNSMLEAMAIGLPCVCTDCLGGGAREMITDGENGLLVPMKDVAALFQAMCRMIDNKELSEKCSENAAKVRKTHNVETIAGKWIDMIQGIT